MYRVIVNDGHYHALSFAFDTMEEVSIFTETVLKKSEAGASVTIEIIREEEKEDGNQ